MTALDDIEAAALALNELSAQEAAQKAAIDAAVSAAIAAKVTRLRVLYIDAVAGLDSNDGSTPAKALATLQAAIALLSAGQRGDLFLLSDITLTAPLLFDGELYIFSNSGGATRTITVTPAALAAAPAGAATVSGGSFAIGSSTWSSIYLSNVNIKVGAITGATSVIMVNGSFVWGPGALSFDPGLTSPIFATGSAMQVVLGNVTLPNGYAGKLFQGTAAGTNPNGPLVQTNITSA